MRKSFLWRLAVTHSLCVSLCLLVCAEINLRHEPELQEGYEQLQRKYAELEDLKSRFNRSYAKQNEIMLVRLTECLKSELSRLLSCVHW